MPVNKRRTVHRAVIAQAPRHRPSILLVCVRAFPSSVGFDSALRVEAVVVLINTPRSSRQLRLCLTEIRAGRERVCGGWPWHIGGREMSRSSAYLL